MVLRDATSSPNPATPLSADLAEDPQDEEGPPVFPVQDYMTLADGLNKAPGWVVYPVHLGNCLDKAARILGDPSSTVHQAEMELIRRFIRELALNAFEKCLDDQALFKWNFEIQVNIFEAVQKLIDLVIVKLRPFASENRVNAVDRDAEDDLVPLLKALSLAFDKASCYHEMHMTDETPLGHQTGDVFALPGALPLPDGSMEHSADSHVEEGYYWLVAFLNDMGSKGGFQTLAKVLEDPEDISISLLRSLMLVLSMSADFLSPETLAPFAQTCNFLLQHIMDVIDNDIEELSMRGSDFSYVNTSQLLGTVFDVLEKHSGPVAAHNKVGRVQCHFVTRMLTFSNFNKHLSAVKETLKVLKRSNDLKASDGGAAMKEILRWTEEKEIVKSMLRGSLHQKQYVDQVQKILHYLLQEGCMTVQHLDLLWSVTEKADTFETVKNNVYSLLVELAFDFSAAQLDLLFSKFESAKDRPASDRVRIVQLLFRIAQSDHQGVIAERLVGLLWNIVAAKDAPVDVVRAGVLADVAVLYEAQSIGMRATLCLKCLDMIGADEQDTLRGLFLLRQLVSKEPIDAGGKPVEPARIIRASGALLESNGASELILKNMEDFVVKHKQLMLASNAEEAEALKSASQGVANPRLRGISERTSTLLFLAKVTGTVLSWDIVERMWNCLITDPVMPQDKEVGYIMFREAFPTVNSSRVIDYTTACRLLTEKFPEQPIKDLGDAGFLCFEGYFYVVGGSDQKLTMKGDMMVVNNLNLSGIGFLWAAATEAQHFSVSNRACSLLIKLHTNLGPELQEQSTSIQRTMLEEVLTKLLDASLTISGTADIMAEDNSADPNTRGEGVARASVIALRCIHLLLDVLDRWSPCFMPRTPAHLGSYSGTFQRVDVNCAVTNGPAQRLTLTLSNADYVGRIRRGVASRLGTTPEHVRLLSAGHELTNDSKIIRQVGIGDGHVMAAGVSDVPNALLRQPAADQPDRSPAGVVTSRPEIYEALLRLVDSPSAGRETRQAAMVMLHTLPTWPVVPKRLLKALTADNVRPAVQKLLSETGPLPAMRFLYLAECLLGLLCPSGGGAHLPLGTPPPDTLIRTVLESGCLEVLLGSNGFKTAEDLSETEALQRPDEERHIVGQTLVVGNVLVKTLLAAPAVAPGQSSAMAPQGGEEEGGHQLPPTSSSGAARLATLDSESFDLIVRHLLGAIRLCGQPSAEGPDAGAGVTIDEQLVIMESLKLLSKITSVRPEILEVIVGYKGIAELISSTILNRSSAQVRHAIAHALLQMFCSADNARRTVMKDSGGEEVSATAWLMQAAAALREEASSFPNPFIEYFQVLLECLQHVSKPSEVRATERLLEMEVEALKSAQPPDSDTDCRLFGHIRLVQEIVRTLDRQGSTAYSRRALVDLLINRLLFPEAAILQRVDSRNATDPNSTEPVDLLDPSLVADALHAPCDSQKTRSLALDLLADVLKGDRASLAHGVQLLMDLHYTSTPGWNFEYQPLFHRRSQHGFCGLKNAGATCYMNATIQQLFMTTNLRSLLLQAADVSDCKKADNVFYQLQVIFAHLALSSLDFYVPQHFWLAFKDYDGEPINLREHQDAFEFLTRLQDLVDQHLSDTRQLQVMKTTMGGKFAQQVICRGVSYRSETEQDFMGISVDVRGKRNLLESLASYVQGELMEGENAYYCEDIGRKVDAVKRACVKTLPNALVIHLKRFEFDFDTMMRWKIKDRFEFPTTLNMYQYTVEGLAEAEGQEIPGGKRPPEYYKYELVGIVVHSGSAFVGHYYSYIKERGGQEGEGDSCASAGGGGEGRRGAAAPGKPPSSVWWSFDDNKVEPWDVANLDRDCFGGKSAVEVFDNATQQHVMQEYDRPNSAYLLVYERTKPQESDVQPPATAEGGAAAAVEGSAEPPANASAVSSAGCVTLSVPGIGPLSIQSSIYRDVTLENLHMVDEMHRLDRDYLRFIRLLVEVHNDLSHSEPSQPKLRRTQSSSMKTQAANSSPLGAAGLDDSVPPVPSPGTLSAELSASSISEQRGEQADQMAVMGMSLATAFLLKLYLRAHSSLREDMVQWRSVMAHLMESSATANMTFLLTVSEPEHADVVAATREGHTAGGWISRYLLACPSQQVRSLFLQLVSFSLRHACQKHGASLDIGQPDPPPGSMSAAVTSLISTLRNVVKEVWQAQPNKVLGLELFYLIQEVALLTPGVTRYLMAINGLQQELAEVAYRLYEQSLHSPSMGTAELQPLFGCLARMLRCCDVLELSDNPFLLPVPAGCASRPSMPPELAKFVVSERFITALVESNMHSPEVVTALQALTWEHLDRSQQLVLAVMEWMATATEEELLRAVDGIARLFTMQDQYLGARLNFILGSNDLRSSHNTILDLIMSDTACKPRAIQKRRFALLRVVVAISERCSPASLVRQCLHATSNHHHDWTEVLKWFEESLMMLQQQQSQVSGGSSGSAKPVTEGAEQQQAVAAAAALRRDEQTLAKLRDLLGQ